MENKNFQRFCIVAGIRLIAPEGSESGIPLTEEQQRDLLAAWGIVPAENLSLEQALAAWLHDYRNQVLPPVLVREEGSSPLSIALRLPDDQFARPLHWELIEENGTYREGTLIPADLQPLEETELEADNNAALRLPIESGLPIGYHRLKVSPGEDAAQGISCECSLIITPSCCYTPPGLLKEARIWGFSLHLDRVRSRRNWGCGDLTDLRNILTWAAESGAGTVALSSLLSRSSSENNGFPELPSSLCFPDPLFLDLEAVADFQESEEARSLVGNPAFQVRLAYLHGAETVASREVRDLKNEVAEILWRHFQLHHLNPETERGWNYRHFQQAGGQQLQAFALFEALREEQQKIGEEAATPDACPHALPDHDAPEASAFADSHGERIEFHQYLQWQMELQLAEAGKRSMELGLKVGLAQTLPAGVDSRGFALWHEPALFCKTATAVDGGKSRSGSHWGPPMLPTEMAAAAYQPFIAALRANMRYAGALRFQAINRLDRQQWRLMEKDEGPEICLTPNRADLLGIIALESQRNRCLIIGEHQAPLSDDFAEALQQRGILASCPGAFARDPQGGWLPPSAYPSRSVVTPTREDLCNLDGFWQGKDIALLAARCPGFTDIDREQAIIARSSERAHLLVALNHEDLLPAGLDLDPAGVAEMSPALIRAVYTFLALTPAQILLVQLADTADLTDLSTRPDQEAMAPSALPALGLPRLQTDLEFLAADDALRQFFREFAQGRTIGVVRPSAPLADRRKQQDHSMPRAFYRLQFNRDCTFLQAAALLPYLRELGISHCYASPYLKARPGSTHGYDIIDHAALNPEIGSRKDYEEFVAALEHNGMAQILDMVPNHMGVGSDNSWWVDVLENGQSSPYAAYFDINWQPSEEELKNRILLPVLGDYFGVVLEEGKLRLAFLPDHGSFQIIYYEHRSPLAPRTYPRILGHDLQRLETRLGSLHEGFLVLQSLITSFADLPGREETNPEQLELRHRNKEVLKRLLARLCRENPEIAVFIEENVLFFNGEPGRAESFDPLEQLLSHQAYRLAFWRVASDEINYRRFFDINELAGLCMERKEVFTQTHRLVLDLIATGRIDGLRIDHPDGLYAPEQYFRELQMAVNGVSAEQSPLQLAPVEQSVRERQAVLPLYVVVEKILAEDEQLPETWMVHGTTGYEFSCLVNGLFVDASAENEMTAIYHRFIGREIDFAVLVHDCKRLIIKSAMAGEINVLSDKLHSLAKRNRYTQDYTLNGLREALTEIVAFFPVYRTYCTNNCHGENDRHHVEQAVERAKARQQAEDTSIYDFIKSVLLPAPSTSPEDRQNNQVVDFVKKFQQYTGPVMAKGLEDTAFYIYNRLLSLNEVGSNPCCFGVSRDTFHATLQLRADKWPHAMLNTSTHDSKRSEDVRARINVLTEMPTQWQQALDRWQRLNYAKKSDTGQGAAPSANDEYALYQNLLGVWPFAAMTGEERVGFLERFSDSMLKVIREAKVHTSWMKRNQAYETAMLAFIDQLLNGEDQAFLDDFIPFQRQIARFGMFNSLSQLLLKLTAPGIPDIYQGNETWQLSLVDPDNRRPVDFTDRREMLEGMKRGMEDAVLPLPARLREFLDHAEDGRIKMYLTWKTLNFRREVPELFSHGNYLPLSVVGAGKDHLCAFARTFGNRVMIVAVPRLLVGLLRGDADGVPLGREIWGETRVLLPGPLHTRRFINILSGEELGTQANNGSDLWAADLFRHFPVALFSSSGDDG